MFDTDQISCFDENGREIDCRGSGQDGEGKSAATGRDHRFRTAGEVVEDTVTQLTWTRDANPARFPMTWSEADRFIAAINGSKRFGGDCWRLPSRRELFSLVSHQQVNPCLPQPHPFENLFDGYYWTGSSCARLPHQTWYIHFGGGRVQRGMKHGSYLVWPVSGPDLEAEPAADRFVARAGGIYDRMTGKTFHASAAPADTAVSWPAALERVRQYNRNGLMGHHDWRLPHIRELEFLVDIRRHSPAVPSIFAVADPDGGYWSATTSIYSPAYAWVLYVRDGAVGVGYKSKADFHVWAVRA